MVEYQHNVVHHQKQNFYLYRGALFYSNEVQQYALPFMGSDPSVVKRTQRYLHEELNESPVSFKLLNIVFINWNK